MTKRMIRCQVEIYGNEKLSDLTKKYGDDFSILINHYYEDTTVYVAYQELETDIEYKERIEREKYYREMKEQSPYICEEVIRTIKKYNPEYGDDRICRCGHQYYRHFDTYEDMYACGCKYCECNEFTVEN